MNPQRQFYDFDNFRLDSSQHVLFRNGQRVNITPKAFETLTVLVQNQGRIIGKDELIRTVWSRTYVEEVNVAWCISALRKALGITDAGSDYIETVPKRGYRFAQPVKQHGPLVEAGRPSIAVLPFADLTADRNVADLCEGLAEELIDDLAVIEGLVVAGRTSAFRFRGTKLDVTEIGKRLNVGAVLSGRIRQFGNKLRVSVELVNVADGAERWAERYDCSLDDIFDVQDRIARSFAEKLKLILLEERSPLPSVTTNSRARELVLKAQHHWNKRSVEGLRRSVELFKLALEEDPNYCKALTGLADTYAELAVFGEVSPPRNVLPLALQALEQAEALGGETVDVLVPRGVLRTYAWQWREAESDFKKAITISPHHPYAHCCYCWLLSATRRFDEAREQILWARDLDPLYPSINSSVAALLFSERSYRSAIETCLDAIELQPNFSWTRFFLGQSYLQLEMYEQAISELTLAANLAGACPDFMATLAYAYAIAGKKADARRILDDLLHEAESTYISPVSLSKICIGLDEKERALDYLWKGYEVGAVGLTWLDVSPIFDSVRSRQCFTDLLDRIFTR